MKKYLLSILVVFPLLAHAEEVTISGKDSAYAGQEIAFKIYDNEITYTEITLAEAIVGKDGSFSVSFNLQDTRYIFSNLGIYEAYLFAVPGRKYEVLLPPRHDKEAGDFLNPYFSPTEVHLALVDFDKKELNTQIRMFNDAYLPYSNKHIVAIRNNEDFSYLDKDIEKMDKPFSGSENEFFNNYRRYKYGMLRHLAFQQKSRSISDEYFMNQPILLNNPAYMDLFNQVYENYFHHFARTKEGEGLGSTVGERNLEALRGLLSRDKVLGNTRLLDLVMLKGIHDEFYDDNYSRSALLTILDQFIEEDRYPEFTSVAIDIRKKTTRLLAGFEPPAFQLYDRDSNLVSLDQFSGKYVYLNFCSCFSYTCLNEFKMLDNLYQKHKDILEIVTIIVDNDNDVINSFLERSNYEWTFLHYGNQASVLQEYDIRAFPTYYLIDREGKLEISPAPSPGDEFEARLFKIMRAKKEL